MSPSKSIPIVSLFSGSGGLDLGFERAGFAPGLALDSDPAAVETYNANRIGKARVAQVRDLGAMSAADISRMWADVNSFPPRGVIGGPPCQAFSAGNVSQSRDDPRSQLLHRYATIVRELAKTFDLDFFVLENVTGLTSPTNRHHFDKFCRSVRRAGFEIASAELNAKEFGVPQTRSRRLVVGWCRQRYAATDFEFPSASHQPQLTVRDALGALPEPVFFARGLDPETFPVHPNHWAMRPRSSKFDKGAMPPARAPGRSFKVLDWDSPSLTVAYGHREVHVHPSRLRRLSVYEAMLLQGFPPDYRLMGTLSDQIRLVSDAVPPPLAQALATSVRKLLGVGARTTSSATPASTGRALPSSVHI
jgi:DNA (cytosine-5)-methyltransferase 1